ncbi:hypothetical protein [Streptomyces malaysiensis]|uniref:hypothetical protein n=1 Tax=Streptomyces malaysiensis TaxID=92644 RepID=UPI002B2C255F|nr:hypothetical protein R8789_40955 [Streptomyces malaysiensis]
MKLRPLAAALLRMDRPGPGSPLWFPERAPEAAPALPFLPDVRPGEVNCGTVVRSVLGRAMEARGQARPDRSGDRGPARPGHPGGAVAGAA